MIKESLIDYETALLLNRHSFAGEYHYEFHLSGTCLVSKEKGAIYSDIALPAPSISLVMKWLRDVHNYYIQVMLDNWVGAHCGYYVIIMKTDSDFGLQLYDEEEQVFYETPEKACEAALKYCLENLI